MVQQPRPARILRAVRFVFAAVAFAACAALGRAEVSAAESPRPQTVPAREAWRIAETYAATHKNCEVMVGSGGSMLPLYPDRTVLIVRRFPMSELKSGMTVVFIGDRGRPVAHILVARTGRGWKARGLANTDNDRTLVRMSNYVGTVVKAFTPVIGLSSLGVEPSEIFAARE